MMTSAGLHTGTKILMTSAGLHTGTKILCITWTIMATMMITITMTGRMTSRVMSLCPRRGAAPNAQARPHTFPATANACRAPKASMRLALVLSSALKLIQKVLDRIYVF